MINYIIIDDEYIAHEIIKGYCAMLPNMQLQKSCYDALEALEFLNNHRVDLIFLDLNLPKLKGFEFLKTLTNPPKIIVTTAYKEFAVEGYELPIADYLLKPFGFERFLKAINKTFMMPTASTTISENKDALSNRIFLRSNKKYFQVEIDAVYYLEASGNYTKVVTIADSILVREKISNVLALLPTSEFLQVHKSFAVSVKHIKSIEGNRIFIAGTTVPVGKVYRGNINELLK